MGNYTVIVKYHLLILSGQFYRRIIIASDKFENAIEGLCDEKVFILVETMSAHLSLNIWNCSEKCFLFVLIPGVRLVLITNAIFIQRTF